MWKLGILSVTILSFCSIMLITVTLNNGHSCQHLSSIISTSSEQIKCAVPALPIHGNNSSLKFSFSLGRWDDQHLCRLFDNVIVGEKFSVLNNIQKTCLATQSSLEGLQSIVDVSDNWSGPISLATLALDDTELRNFLMAIHFLRKCSVKIREQVTFHFAFLKDFRPTDVEIDLSILDDWNCDDPKNVLKQLTQYKSDVASKNVVYPSGSYPQNHLRNLARKNCASKFVFLTDIDIIPCKGMAEKLDRFLGETKNYKLSAFVVPTYEIDDMVKFPQNKTELLRLVSKKLAQPFHKEVFAPNHFATDFSQWEKTNDLANVHVNHLVTNFEILYEPFYIAEDIVPPHEESFVGYGYTRSTQVYEMFLAGYKFLVLSPIFTCRRGLQHERMDSRVYQTFIKSKPFRDFKRKILTKYKANIVKIMTLENKLKLSLNAK